jgi:5'-nucleotidase
VAKFVKLMKHDMMALGNHEFDDGIDGLVPFIRNVTDINNDNSDDNLPILAANVDFSNEPLLKDYIKKSLVLTINQRRIAIIGYITPDTTFLSRPGNTLIFNDEIESINNEITQLKAQYSDLNIFIACGHSGLSKDKEIASKIADLDLVVGGHSHSFLYTGTPPSNDRPVDRYPVVFNHAETSSTTLVVQAFAYGKYLGKLDLNFDNDGKIIAYSGQPILLDSSITEGKL